MLTIDSENILWKEVDGVVIVLKLATGDFCEFNAMGSLIWKMLAEGHSTNAITNKIAELYDSSEERITQDVQHFVNTAIARGLIDAQG